VPSRLSNVLGGVSAGLVINAAAPDLRISDAKDRILKVCESAKQALVENMWPLLGTTAVGLIESFTGKISVRRTLGHGAVGFVTGAALAVLGKLYNRAES
jgi:hypothetical protein